MALRSSVDLEMRPLVKALRARINGLGPSQKGPKDRFEIYTRSDVPFLQLEIKRDHMNLDLWLPADSIQDAKATGLARAHPFLGDDAVVVRFERAEDLTKVARWLEASYRFAPVRPQGEAQPIDDRPKKSRRKAVAPLVPVDGAIDAASTEKNEPPAPEAPAAPVVPVAAEPTKK